MLRAPVPDRSINYPRCVGWQALAALIGIGSLPVFGIPAPLWLQPAWVGLLWGVLFLLGLYQSHAKNQDVVRLAAVVLASVMLTVAFTRITDLHFCESLLASVMLFLCGWMVGNFDSSSRRLMRGRSEKNSGQVSMLNLFVITTLVACALHAFSNLQSPMVTLVGVMGTLIIGCTGCWAAAQWAWNDRRPIGMPLALAVAASIIGFGLLRRSSPGMTLGDLSTWLLAGPISVLAAQVMVVLAVLGLVRQSHSTYISSPHRQAAHSP
jgi:hypothetical protein